MKIAVTIGFGKSKQYFINKAYISFLTSAGYEPILLVPGNNMIEVAKQCSGLVLPGGIDLDPTYYREDNWQSYAVIPEYDAFERSAFYAFLEAGKKIFGICRGFQLIAREFLHQFPEYDGAYNIGVNTEGQETTPELNFLQHLGGHSQTDSLSLARTVVSHMIDYNPKLFGEKGQGTEFTFVNSMHHQALHLEMPKKKTKPKTDVGPMTLLAWTRKGLQAKEVGVIVEAFEINDWLAGKILAVQWHPEELEAHQLLNNIFGKPNGKKKQKISDGLNQ